MIKKFEMSMMGELSYFLGLQIKHYDKGISICQEQYIRNLLKKYEISDSSLVKTSMVPPNNLGLYLAVKPFNEALYKGMIRYLKGTLSLGLYYLKCLRFDLKRYLDSDYAGCIMDRKSILGACQILGGKLVCWSAKKEQLVANVLILIKFLVLNGKNPLAIDLKTFCPSTGLDYKNGKYVAHPSPHAVKAELAKIVLDENYSSNKQIKYIQQMIAYCLITGTKVDIGEIIYNDLVTKLTSKSELKYVSYPRFMEVLLEIGDEIFKARDEMDEEVQRTYDEENQSPSPKKDQPGSSHAQKTKESDPNSSCHVVLKKYDNILPLTKRQLV
nr:hypothetical protein [Tanacetum cinerariifolium]